MADRNFYDILGVAKTATDDELKRAYRKMAMQYHPDRNPGDAKAEQAFKDVNEAYDTLKDAQKRAAYDRFGHQAYKQGAGGGGGSPFGGGAGGFEFNGNMEDLFEDLMGGLFGGGGNAQATRRRTSNRGADLRYNLEVDLAQAFTGIETPISFTTSLSCTTCRGSGAKPGTKPVTCTTCNGSGNVAFRQGFFSMTRPCPDCGGRGTQIKDPCTDCRGTGRTRQSRTVTVNVPPGVDDGTRLRLAGEGEDGMNGGPGGDLYVFINLRKHPLYTRDGIDLHATVPLPFTDAMLGTDITLPTPTGGKHAVKVPENTQPGTVLRLRGQGMPELGSPRHRGDILVHLNVEHPQKLTPRQRELLEEFKQSWTPSNREKSFWISLKGLWSDS